MHDCGGVFKEREIPMNDFRKCMHVCPLATLWQQKSERVNIRCSIKNGALLIFRNISEFWQGIFVNYISVSILYIDGQTVYNVLYKLRFGGMTCG